MSYDSGTKKERGSTRKWPSGPNGCIISSGLLASQLTADAAQRLLSEAPVGGDVAQRELIPRQPTQDAENGCYIRRIICGD